MKLIATALLLCAALPAQIVIKLTPDTQSQTAVIGKAHGLQYWVLTEANIGPAPRTLNLEQIIIASPVNLIPLVDAKNVIGARIARGFWGSLLHYGGIGAEVATAGLAIARGFTTAVPQNLILGLGIGGSLSAGVQQIAANNQVSAAALLNQLSYPLQFGAEGSATAFATDHEFSSGWQKGQQAVVITIP